MLLAQACDADSDAKPAAKPSAAKRQPAKQQPFTGTLTGARLREHGKLVSVFDPWPEALEKLEASFGKPTAIVGNTYHWAAIDGDKCSSLSVDQDGDAVGMIAGPSEVDEVMKSMYGKCLAAAGKAPDPAAVDSDAPAPPADGVAIDVATLRAGVEGAKARWVGRKVTLTGRYSSTSSSKANGKTTRSLSITGQDGGKSVGCDIGEADAPVLTQGDEVQVEGKVTAMFGGWLEDCVVSPKT